jgi:MFS family permease
LNSLRLLRDNPGFARLWAAEVVSLGGDWFTIIALAVLVSRHTGGSGVAVGALLLTQLLPAVVFAPIAGVVVDRSDKRRLLIATDLIRAVIVLALIPAARLGRDDVLYVLAFLHFTIATVFEPARAALMTRLLAEKDLVAGSTLSSVTWSVMVALGGLAGGSLLAVVGPANAFAWDAFTFLVSASIMAAIPASAGQREAPPREGPAEVVRFSDAIQHLRRQPVTGATTLVKSMNGVAVADTFMVLYGTRVFALGHDGALSLGLIYGSFGVGAVLGPTLLNLLNDGSPARMRRLIAAGAALLAAGLLLLAAAPTLWVACLAIVLRGAGGSALWTYSTIILQKVIPGAMLGRVFAIDFAVSQLAAVSFALFWGALMDRVGLRPVVLAAAVLATLPCLLWTWALPRMDRREAAVH